MMPSGYFSSLKSVPSREHLTGETWLDLAVKIGAGFLQHLRNFIHKHFPPERGSALVGGNSAPRAQEEFNRWESAVRECGRGKGCHMPTLKDLICAARTSSMVRPASALVPTATRSPESSGRSEPSEAPLHQEFSWTLEAPFLKQNARHPVCSSFLSSLI